MKEVLTWLKERQLDTNIIEIDSMQVIEELQEIWFSASS